MPANRGKGNRPPRDASPRWLDTIRKPGTECWRNRRIPEVTDSRLDRRSGMTPSVAFRSAKGRSFAERKTTLAKALQLMNPTPSHPTPARYMPQLDGLRAIAVFSVAWSHWMRDYCGGLPVGHFGVQLFFVLSGFLITGILLRAKPEPGESRGPVLRQFFVRRALRIFPAYYLVLSVVWLANYSDTRATIIWHASYLTNIQIFVNKSYSPLAHFWSLSVEEQFYLIWPWIVLWTSPRTLLRVLIGMIIGASFLQVALVTFLPRYESTVLMPVAADALGAGALLALVEGRADWKATFRPMAWLVCLPLFVLLQSNFHLTGQVLPWGAEAARKTVMVVSFTLLISGAASGFRGPVGWMLSHPLLTGIGKISYGIYLIHYFVPELVTWILNQTRDGAGGFDALHPGWRFEVYWVTTLVLAGTSWFLVERPCLQLKERWGQAPS